MVVGSRSLQVCEFGCATVYTFTNSADGLGMYAGVTIGSGGTLYGAPRAAAASAMAQSSPSNHSSLIRCGAGGSSAPSQWTFIGPQSETGV
jgi:hypothetical protein